MDVEFGKQAFKELLTKEVEDRLSSLKDIDKLSSIEALEKATNIVTLVNKIIDIGVDNPADFYDKAKMAYLIAAEKVPKNERDKVAFPSNFWSMRSKQERAGKLIFSPEREEENIEENIPNCFDNLINILERGIKEAEIGGSKDHIDKLGNILDRIKDVYADFLKIGSMDINKLSELDYKIINFIGINGPSPLKIIYPKLMVARPTVSYHIDRLIDYGILIRIPTVIKDKPIDLTEKGKEIFLMINKKR